MRISKLPENKARCEQAGIVRKISSLLILQLDIVLSARQGMSGSYRRSLLTSSLTFEKLYVQQLKHFVFKLILKVNEVS